jgi:UDP-N-acetylglucosamine transferase subunit ALG13
MIFVTVGTHEQPFDRLLKAIDSIAAQTDEPIVVQSGYTDYQMQHCTWSKLLPYKEMVKHVERARIVITHGGPSSFIMPLQMGKIPIVVPRQKKYDEHVNDHQLTFAREIASRQKNIFVVEDVQQLAALISGYEEQVSRLSACGAGNNAKFMEGFQALVNELMP